MQQSQCGSETPTAKKVVPGSNARKRLEPLYKQGNFSTHIKINNDTPENCYRVLSTGDDTEYLLRVFCRYNHAFLITMRPYTVRMTIARHYHTLERGKYDERAMRLSAGGIDSRHIQLQLAPDTCVEFTAQSMVNIWQSRKHMRYSKSLTRAVATTMGTVARCWEGIAVRHSAFALLPETCSVELLYYVIC